MFTRHRILNLLAVLLILSGLALTPATISSVSAATVCLTLSPTSSLTPLYLDVEGASGENGARIIQWYWTGASNQTWQLINDPVNMAPDVFAIQSGTGKVLTVNSYVAGAPVLQWSYQHLSSQHWRRYLVPNDQHGDWRFQNTMTGLFLDVKGHSLDAGTPLIQWYNTDRWNQRFDANTVSC